MHIHNVYFWLNEGEDQVVFADGLRALTQDPDIEQSFFGPPAGTERDVVDSSYSFGLVLVFADLVAHDRYQIGAVHKQFLDDHLHRWSKVSVFDVASA